LLKANVLDLAMIVLSRSKKAAVGRVTPDIVGGQSSHVRGPESIHNTGSVRRVHNHAGRAVPDGGGSGKAPSHDFATLHHP
jgi:hypothetical protein